MPINRFFDKELQQDNVSGQLTGDEMHHALKVFRLKQGDEFEVINGKGLLASCKLTQVSKKHLEYQVLSKQLTSSTSNRTSLILGMPKFNRLETIIEKVCELGIDEIILFNADRSEKVDLSANQWQRVELIVQASLKQSGRLFMPHIECLPSLKRALELDRTFYFGDVEAKGPVVFSSTYPRAIVIGPESGFSDQEIALLKTKAHGTSLSDAILRVDTAAIIGSFLIRNY